MLPFSIFRTGKAPPPVPGTRPGGLMPWPLRALRAAGGNRGRQRRWSRDGRGNMGVLTSILAVPMLALSAAAVDFSAAMQARAQLDLAADQALMAAVNAAAYQQATQEVLKTAARAAAAAGGRESDDDDDDDGKAGDAHRAARNLGVNRFRGGASRVAGVAVDSVTLTIEQTGTTTFTGNLAYSATRSGVLSQLLGYLAIPLSSSARVALTAGQPYVDIHILMDISGSMMIPATAAGISNLMRLVAQPNARGDSVAYAPCAFACHSNTTGTDNYGIARRNGIRLRFDDLKDAIARITSSLDARNAARTFRVAFYTFATDLSPAAPLTDRIGEVAARAADTRMPLVAEQDMTPWFTDVSKALRSLAGNYLPDTSGRRVAETPRQYVFLLTDGMQSGYGEETTGMINTNYLAACDALKATGAILLVLHTQLHSVEGAFDYLVEVQPAATAALQACASSPAHYFPVTETDAINTAMNAMLAIATVNPARFTR